MAAVTFLNGAATLLLLNLNRITHVTSLPVELCCLGADNSCIGDLPTDNLVKNISCLSLTNSSQLLEPHLNQSVLTLAGCLPMNCSVAFESIDDDHWQSGFWHYMGVRVLLDVLKVRARGTTFLVDFCTPYLHLSVSMHLKCHKRAFYVLG